MQKKCKLFIGAFLVVMTCGGVYYSVRTADSTYSIFSQSDWSSGQSSIVATHVNNQTGWSQYSGKDSGIVANTEIALANIAVPIVKTTQTDFSSGTFSGSAVSGMGTSASLQLQNSMSLDSGTGADGAYACNSGVCTLNGGTYNYTTFTIAAGATVNITGTSPLVVRATDNVTIDGTLNLFGSNGNNGGTCTQGNGGAAKAGGYAGGDGGRCNYAGNPGMGTLGGAGGAKRINNSGGPGGGGGGANSALISGGSGGGGGGGGYYTGSSGGGGGGGAGGGSVEIYAQNNISVSGMINASGGNGGSGGPRGGGYAGGGGGGGGGGKISLNSTAIANYGTIIASGGSGVSIGTGGIIILNYNSFSGTIPSAPIGGTLTNTNTSGYVLSGNFASSIIDVGTTAYFTNIDYTTELIGQILNVDMRAGNTVTPDGTWTPWQSSLSDGADISVFAGNRYIQYRVNFSTTDAGITPKLNDITFNYIYYPSNQILTSTVYDTQTDITKITSLTWTETLLANTDIRFQLRTSPNGTSWSVWCGPDDGVPGSCNSSTYFTNPVGGEVVDDTQRDEIGDRYIQYKAVLSSADGQNSPVLHDILLSYEQLSMAAIVTQGVTGITEHAAMPSATVTNTGNDNPQRFIQYGIQSGTYTSECTAGTGSTGQYSCQITNLTPNTTYYYRAKATNSAGTSYGNEMFFTTLALQDTTISNPDPTKIQNKVSEGYFQLNAGTIINTTQVTTAVNVTIQDTIFNAVFPQNTTITETTNQPFNFQNLTAENVTETARQEQPTSRAAVRIGIPGEKLDFSQLVTLTVSVGEAFNGQTLDILYQQEGESTWHTHGTCTVSNGQCVFTTNHATIYTINGNHQTTGDTPMNLNVQVQETLSMDCFDPSDSNTTVSLGTTTNPGLITAGTPAVGQSRCTVTTNADQGYYLTLTNSNPTHATLTHTDPHTGTLYEIQDTAQWNETTKATSNWTAPTTKGLGFSVITFPEVDTTHNEFNGVWNTTNQCPEGLTADTNEYAGIPATPQTISAVTSYQSAATTTNICYKVDVPASQPSGQYSGQVMFTATSDASGYYQ